MAWSKDGRFAAAGSDGLKVYDQVRYAWWFGMIFWSLSSACFHCLYYICSALFSEDLVLLDALNDIGINSVAWAPDGRLALAWNDRVRIYDQACGCFNMFQTHKGLGSVFEVIQISVEHFSGQNLQLQRELVVSSSPIKSVAWSDDGLFAAAASDGSEKLYDKARLLTYVGHVDV